MQATTHSLNNTYEIKMQCKYQVEKARQNKSVEKLKFKKTCPNP